METLLSDKKAEDSIDGSQGGDCVCVCIYVYTHIFIECIYTCTF